uniref:357_80_1 protein n=1 Tax=Mamestra configurata TaxID=174822 RepID=F6K725_9NEOP|nr:357_80_1 protein [Mamestra configurata]
MKSFIFIAVLAALTVCNDAASVPNEVAPSVEEVVEFPESVEEYIKDVEGPGRQLREDEFILFYEESFNLEAIPHTVQHRDVFYRGNSTTHIRRTTVSNPPTVPGNTYVGMFTTYAHVRITSAPGVGLRNTVRFYGIYTDWPRP